MRYLVLPIEGGYQVVDTHIDRPVTLGMELKSSTDDRSTADRYADTLNRTAEALGIGYAPTSTT